MSRWLAVLCTVTFVVLAGLGIGCSSDDIVGDATAEAVEAGLNDALRDEVVPLVIFLGSVPTIVNGGARPGLGLVCPDTSGVCSGGSVNCTVVNNEYSFDFNQCVVATGDVPFTLTGNMTSTSSDPYDLTFSNLSIDNNNAISGTGSVSVAGCSYTVNVGTTNDTGIIGTLVQCDTDNYPTNQSSLTITLDNGNVNLIFSFDGSNIANAIAYQGKEDIAECDVNMAADPISSSCHAP